MEKNPLFQLPEMVDGPCVNAPTCANVVHGVLGKTICETCSASEKREEWVAFVQQSYAEATASLPDAFRSVMPERAAECIKNRDAAVTTLREWESSTLLILGDSGSGKTTLAAALFRKHLRMHARGATESRVLKAASSRYVRAFTMGARADWDNADDVLFADLLLVDDLGLEPVTMAAMIINVLITRIDDGRPTLVTSGCDEATIARRYGSGVFRRLMQKHPAFYAAGARVGDS